MSSAPPIFAADTDVPVERSRAGIEKLLDSYQCRKFSSGIDRAVGKAALQFELSNRLLRFEIDWPIAIANLSEPWRKRWNATRSRDVAKFLAQVERQRWRAMHLVIKAKLEAVSSGVATFDEEFMPYIVLPNNQTVAQTMVPLIEQAYRDGRMPRLPLMLTAAGNDEGATS